jgi:hypothetical protein
MEHRAIGCISGWGPHFCDIAVFDNCNANANSDTFLGSSYSNDTEQAGSIVFTGSKHFQVKEIEVFEIKD